MKFTRQDALTFFLGLLVALLYELRDMDITVQSFSDPAFRTMLLGTLSTSAFRYLATRLPEMWAKITSRT